LQRLARIDPASVTPESMREVYAAEATQAPQSQSRKEQA
jgi:malonate decarboxylase beta subunit